MTTRRSFFGAIAALTAAAKAEPKVVAKAEPPTPKPHIIDFPPADLIAEVSSLKAQALTEGYEPCGVSIGEKYWGIGLERADSICGMKCYMGKGGTRVYATRYGGSYCQWDGLGSGSGMETRAFYNEI